MDARNEFFGHAEQAQAYITMGLSETDTRVYLIDPALRIFGYTGPRDIRREVPVPATRDS